MHRPPHHSHGSHPPQPQQTYRPPPVQPAWVPVGAPSHAGVGLEAPQRRHPYPPVEPEPPRRDGMAWKIVAVVGGIAVAGLLVVGGLAVFRGDEEPVQRASVAPVRSPAAAGVPSPTAAQRTALLAGLREIDPELAEDGQAVSLAVEVCRSLSAERGASPDRLDLPRVVAKARRLFGADRVNLTQAGRIVRTVGSTFCQLPS